MRRICRAPMRHLWRDLQRERGVDSERSGRQEKPRFPERESGALCAVLGDQWRNFSGRNFLRA